MKVCPTCSNQWPDEQKFCPNDGSALKSTSGSADLVGSVIAGNYHITKKLGEGGMGAVYLGEHVKMGRKSAIKVMTQSMAHDPDAIARFNREATNAARINHPNVCAIYDFGETSDGLIYLAMEFIEGGSLSSVVEQGPVPPARAAAILEQAGQALSAAHHLGIVHRDLKPDNIMISKGRDGTDVVKVVDFGIAKAMGGEEGQKVTKTGLVVGTPEYMSPEQLSGDKLDGRSDIYSLALVFYRMLTGTLPFQADSAQETMIKRLTDDPMPLNDAMPGSNFPARLQAVMDRALTRMPAERYASASEFARDAARALEGVIQEPVGNEGATQLIDTAKTAQIAQTRVGGGKPGKTAIKTPETPLPQPIPVAGRKKSSMALVAAIVGVVVVGGGTAAVMLGGKPGGNGDQNSSSGAKQQDTIPATDNTANKQLAANPSAGTPNPAGNQSQTANRPPITPRGQTGNSQTQTVIPVNPQTQRGIGVDSAAIDAELGKLLDDSFEPDKHATVRQRASDIYSIGTYPKSLRGQAAFLVSTIYQAQGKGDEACQWVDRALGQQPAQQSYRDTRQKLACQ